VLEGLLEIVQVAEARYVKKYLHLLWSFDRLGLVTLPEKVYTYAFPKVRRGLSATLKSITVNSIVRETQVEVVYVQPNEDPVCKAVSFAMFQEVVAQYIDLLSQAFAKHLLIWQDVADDRVLIGGGDKTVIYTVLGEM
jgi:hypothetical protein